MKKQIFILSLIIWCVSSVLAYANVPLMPVEDIVPGMRGIAKTVIAGDTIEEFDVEVLGVIGNDAMGHNILIKASGDVIDRSGGIAQGMSGSPVYINGRLAGAVAFGKAFTDPQYCFLTPIGRMLDLLNEPPVGSSSPIIVRKMVLLPLPDGPRIANVSPCLISRSISSITTCSPKAIFNFCKLIIGSATGSTSFKHTVISIKSNWL